MEEKRGKVWLVGAGPSDPGLMTVKGAKVLAEADVVVYDKLVGIQILNQIPKSARRIDVGKHPQHHPVPQEKINQLLLDEALAGNRVVRLKGGDPFLFGRGGEELELLSKNQIPFEVVPGITSAIAVPAYSGIPVTHRDFCSSVHIITGHTKHGEEPDLDFDAAVRIKGTLVFLMGIASLQVICKGLLDAKMPPDMPAAIIERGTTARQRRIISTIQNLPAEAEKHQLSNPAVIVVGKVCSLAQEFDWTRVRPLNGKRVVVTRPESLNSVLSEKIRMLGGEALEFPCIKTLPLEDSAEFAAAVERIRTYDWIVFTSAFGVEMLFDQFRQTRRDVRELYGLKLAVIGTGTEKAFAEKGIRVDFLPENYNVRSFGEELANQVKPGERVLALRARDGSRELNQLLSEAGIPLDDVPAYQTVIHTEGITFSKELIEDFQFDYAAFTSASTVRGFVNAVPGLDHTKVNAVCIGEETAKEARKHGMNCTVARQSTLDDLVDCIVALEQRGDQVRWN